VTEQGEKTATGNIESSMCPNKEKKRTFGNIESFYVPKQREEKNFR
jgi:hypothetical protein